VHINTHICMHIYIIFIFKMNLKQGHNSISVDNLPKKK
jgi:hypothetical protein